MHRLLVLALLLPLTAVAQAPTSSLSTRSALGQLTGNTAPSVERWLVIDTESKRFPVGDTVGPAFKEGDRVTVVFDDTALERVRIELEGRFGWVSATALAANDPARVQSDFDIDALLKSLSPQDE
jgi:hypothetical protein